MYNQISLFDTITNMQKDVINRAKIPLPPKLKDYYSELQQAFDNDDTKKGIPFKFLKAQKDGKYSVDRKNSRGSSGHNDKRFAKPPFSKNSSLSSQDNMESFSASSSSLSSSEYLTKRYNIMSI
jgi:hypothetical protein